MSVTKMNVEEFRMLNDYFKTLSHAQSDGIKVGNELQQVMKKINEGLGLNDYTNRKTKVGTDHLGKPVYDMVEDLSSVSTKHLYEELLNREGITEHIVSPHGVVDISIDNDTQGCNTEIKGAAKILVNKD